MRQYGAAASALIFASFARSQTPDIAIKLDLRGTYVTTSGGVSKFRWYDPMGHHSTVGFTALLEPGYRTYVAQRLQRIANDADSDQLDEGYVEDPGFWRVGRQFIPFGERNILRESVLAVRLDTSTLTKPVPISICACDGGPGRPRGLTGRIGERLGLSFAAGNHFSISATALDQIRRPEGSPGNGHGYKLALGVDYSRRVGYVIVNAEFVALRHPDVTSDSEENVSDVRATLRPLGTRARIVFAWSRAWRSRRDFYRAEGEIPLPQNLSLLPFLRFSRGELRDVGLTLRIKL